jgi:hypothetical protein
MKRTPADSSARTIFVEGVGIGTEVTVIRFQLADHL